MRTIGAFILFAWGLVALASGDIGLAVLFLAAGTGLCVAIVASGRF